MVSQLAGFVYLLLTGANNFNDQLINGDNLFKALLAYFGSWFGDGKSTILDNAVAGINLGDYQAWAVVVAWLDDWFVMVGIVVLVIKVIKRCFGA